MNKALAMILAALAFAAFAVGTNRVTKTRLGSLNPRSGEVVTDVTFEGLADATNVYTKAETEAKIVELAPAPDYSTNNAELVATIEATAPAPGNYAAVSNAAVHAAITNALQDTALESHASQLSQLSQSLDGKADREIVIGQGKGLPGDCFPIAYVYNGGSYSIADSGGIVVDQIGPAYYRLADSVTGVAVCYFRISDGAYFSNAEASGITFGGTAPTQLAWPVLGDVAKKSSVVYDVDIKTNYYDKAETEAKIVELAPAPGNYATVSNAAVHAAITNALQDAAISTINDTKASKADATLTFSPWRCVPAELIDPLTSQRLSVEVRYEGNAWELLVVGGTGDPLATVTPGDPDARSLEFNFVWDSEPTTVTATRAYQLGDQSDKPLASEAEAEALRNGKQDNLPYPTNSIPYAAISGKPTLATVATSGSYNDLSNKPTIPTVPTAQINAATTTNALQDAAIGSLVNTVSEKPDVADIPPAVSNIVTTALVRERLGVWMEYDEATGFYYYCHEEE